MDARSRGAATWARPNFNTLYYVAAAAATHLSRGSSKLASLPPTPHTHEIIYLQLAGCSASKRSCIMQEAETALPDLQMITL
jgi:hypothetical protein